MRIRIANFMLILGIDPGTTAVGYALLENKEGKQQVVLADLIHISSKNNEGRLVEIYKGIRSLLKNWHPKVLGIERLFFAKNQKTALAVAQARGVILLTAVLAGLKVYEYTPLEIKKAVSGDGRADKKQIKKILELTLPELKHLNISDDVLDAIAIALTCYYKERLQP